MYAADSSSNLQIILRGSVSCQQIDNVFSASQQPNLGPGRLLLRFLYHTQTHTHTHISVVHLCTSDQLIVQAATTQHTSNTRDEHRRPRGQIRNRGPNNQAAAQLHFRPRDHRDRRLTNQSYLLKQIAIVLYCILLYCIVLFCIVLY
jgi:hypothetical protein